MDLKLLIILLTCTVVAESSFFRDFSIWNPFTMDEEAVKFNFDNLRNLIPGRDLIQIPYRPRNHKNKKYIPIFDENSNIVSYLREISETIEGRGVVMEDELEYIISGIDGNENIIPNKIKVIKEVFKKVSLPAEEKMKLSKWILDLGGTENDLTNVDILHKFISNIDEEGNTMEDFSNLTDWTLSLEGNVEMPFIGDLSNFLPRHDLDENLQTYFKKITDSLKSLDGNGMDISFIKDFEEMTHKLNEHESKIPNKVATLKQIFYKNNISMNTKAKIAQFFLDVGGLHHDFPLCDFDLVHEMVNALAHLQDCYKHTLRRQYKFSTCRDFCKIILSGRDVYPPNNKPSKKILLQDCLDDLVKTVQHFSDLFKHCMGQELQYSACKTFCFTFYSDGHTHLHPADLLKHILMQFSDQTIYQQSSSNNLVLDHLGTARRSLCSSGSGGRQLISAYKDPENECKVHCAYQNELEVLNSSDGWSCRDSNDSKYGVCHRGQCVLEVAVEGHR